jgi:hypothetical protein
VDQLGKVVKDSAAWNGPELTDSARAQYRFLLGKLSLVPHDSYPVSLEDIICSAPVLERRPLSRYGAWQRR